MNLTVRTFEYLAGVKTALNVSTGGFVINGIPSISPGTSYNTSITNNTSVLLSIMEGGYYVYNVDINNVFNINKTIDIILVKIESIVSSNYNKPYPNFFYFQDPYSFKTYGYNGSSFSGVIEWYYNNVSYGNSDKIVLDTKLPISYQLKIRGTTYEPLGGLRYDSVFGNIINGNVTPGVYSDTNVYLASDLTKNITEIEFRPTFYLTASDPEDLGQTNLGYARGETVIITPVIELNNSSTYTVKYEITNPLGIVTSTTISYIDIPSVITSFSLPELGNYNVKATLSDIEGNVKYYSSININTINFINISYDSCNTFKFENRSTYNNIFYEISSLTEIVQINTGLLANTSTLLVLPGTNLYTIKVSYNGIIEYYLINNYCDLEDCILKGTLDIFCDPTCDPCDKIENELDLIRLFAISNTYFMKLHKEYYINNFYTSLDQTKLDELTTIKQTLDQLSVLCARMGCLDKTSDCGCNGSTKKGKGDCGCH